jgi:peptidoglycan hydrolase-like protein with peptidoglycan-binding domain
MAFIQMFPENVLVGSAKGWWFYNVSFAVGPSAPNIAEDVRLVQTMLAKLGTSLPISTQGLVADGRFGPETESHILAAQKLFRQMGLPVVADGRVDRARGLFGSISHSIYTIVQLNLLLRSLHPEYFPPLDGIGYGLPPVLSQIKRRGVPPG